ncbi:MAG: alkaline phosphatase [Pseudomonadota bacterium]
MLDWIEDGKLAVAAVVMIAAFFSAPAQAACELNATGNGAIFYHPDGTSMGHWDVTRILYYGPDGSLNWDRLPQMAAYRGHLTDRLTSSSNAGATVHATGTRTWVGAFGLDEDGNEVRAANGSGNTIMQDAVECDLGTALVQTGSLIEPGTAVFVSEAEDRYADREEIALEVVESNVDVILGAGEEWLLPDGIEGRFGAGRRSDGRNLVEELRDRGYAVVYTRAEMHALPADVDKVFGVFNVEDTFFDRPEEELRDEGLPNFIESAPTVAEMTDFALARIKNNPNGFLAVIEEEGSDNFCNKMNASGCLEAMKRADDGIGRILEFIDANPDTFMVTASDSNAGGMQISGQPSADVPVPAREDGSGAALDGVDGTATMPFISAPDRTGKSFPFAVVWASSGDIGSGVVARGAGLHAEMLVPSSGVANTDIYRMLYFTLFGQLIPQNETLDAATTRPANP